MHFGFLFFVSVMSGLLGSLSGIGSGVVLVPVLTFFGIPIKEAIGICSIATLTISLGATSVYIRRHIPNLNVGAFLGFFGVLGAGLGAFATTVYKGQRILYLLYGGLLFIFSWVLRRNFSRVPKIVERSDPLSRWFGWEGMYYDEAEKRTIHYKARNAFYAAPLMFGASFFGGGLGFGLSAFFVLIQEILIGLPTKVSLSTNQIITSMMSLMGVEIFLEAGLIRSSLVAPVVFGALLGAFLGSKLLVYVDTQVVRIFLQAMTILLGVEMIIRGVRSGS